MFIIKGSNKMGKIKIKRIIKNINFVNILFDIYSYVSFKLLNEESGPSFKSSFSNVSICFRFIPNPICETPIPSLLRTTFCIPCAKIISKND